MKYLHLIWAALFRSKTRTSLTLLSVVAAFLLFGMLDSVRVAFNSGGSVEGANRLVVASRLSITQSLPIKLQPQIEAVPGVEKTAYAMWFGAIYQDPKNFFPSFSISDNYFDLYRDFDIPAEQLQAYQKNRTGAIVGASLAKRFGWKIGDTVPIRSNIWTKKEGGNTWQMKIAGIYESTNGDN